ncbi:unnamed protein product [Camellia sinensis]
MAIAIQIMRMMKDLTYFSAIGVVETPKISRFQISVYRCQISPPHLLNQIIWPDLLNLPCLVLYDVVFAKL